MGDLRVRDVDESVIAELRARADRAGTSVSALVRDVLAAEARRPRLEWRQRLEQLHEAMHQAHGGPLPDSTPLIREERDRIG